ncbi:MAG: 3-phosphoshikimate 1-carboxyvinyltransferase, partial [Brooklawnia sp.]
LRAASELTPVVAALAAFAEGITTITGVGHIRGHETDRLAAISAELASVGVDASQTDDGLVIVGAGSAGEGLRPTRPLRSYADHRLAHLAALVGLVVPGVVVDDITAVDKTMPDFTSRWRAMLTQVAGAGR